MLSFSARNNVWALAAKPRTAEIQRPSPWPRSKGRSLRKLVRFYILGSKSAFKTPFLIPCIIIIIIILFFFCRPWCLSGSGAPVDFEALAVSIERYILVFHPLRYRAYFTRKRNLFLVLFYEWLVPLCKWFTVSRTVGIRMVAMSFSTQAG